MTEKSIIETERLVEHLGIGWNTIRAQIILAGPPDSKTTTISNIFLIYKNILATIIMLQSLLPHGLPRWQENYQQLREEGTGENADID